MTAELQVSILTELQGLIASRQNEMLAGVRYLVGTESPSGGEGRQSLDG
ncbi:MAG: hypothetical protein WKF84_28555 [Pyrinomonadaceae bacterium]